MMTLHYNDTTLAIQPSDDSYRHRQLMGGDTLSLTFDLPRWVDFPVGTWCEHQAARYTLRTPATVRKDGERIYRYTLAMEADASHIGRYKLRNMADNRLKFSLCATPREYAQLIVDNLDRRDGDGAWAVGTCIEAAEKTVAFDHTYVADALRQVAEAFDTEWEIIDRTVSLRRVEYFKDNPLPLSYGRGNGFVPGVGRATRSDSLPVEILYVQGGSRNIDRSRYGSAELLLPKSQTLVYEGRTYASDADGLSIRRADKEITYHNEDSLDCSDIYPSRVGTVTSVSYVDEEENLYDFADYDIPDNLDYAECLMAGETLTVIFQSGMLAGREFEAAYHHEGGGGKMRRRFELKPQEMDGVMMPNGTFKPQVGDKYAVFGIMLPNAYVCDNATQTGASWDMFREAARYLYEHEDPRFTFTGELQGLWAKRNWLAVGGRLVVGGYVLFTDPQIAPGGVPIRITAIKDYLNAPHSPELELSNEAAGTSLSSALGKLEADQVLREEGDRRAQQFTRRRFRDAQQTIAMLEEALLAGFTESISPVAVRTMSLLAGDESLQFQFVDPATLEPAVWNATYDTEAKKFTAPAGTVMHYTLGITTLSPTHDKKDYLRWTLPAYPSPVLDDPQRGYYLYARVPRESGAGAFLLTPEARDLHAEEDFYHLLVGVLTSEGADGGRSFVTLYGFTEILPGRITTDKIVSADGQTYFDLAAGEIGGNIKFRSTANNELVDVEQAIGNLELGSSGGVRLLKNGDGSFGNNYNFPTCVYRGEPYNGSAGSFLLKNTYNKSDGESEQFIPIDPNKAYRVGADVCSLNSKHSVWLFYAQYDIDKNRIQAIHALFVAGTLTELAQDLNDGDMVVHFTSLDGWDDTIDNANHLGFIFWDYANSKGYTYPPETYSRHRYDGLWDSATAVDKEGNTITLKSPWNKGTVKAGTKLSQTDNGGSHHYFMTGTVLPTEWAHYEVTVQGVKANSRSASKFWPGCAYVKMGWLANFGGNTEPDEVYAANMFINEDVPTREDVDNSVQDGLDGIEVGGENLITECGTDSIVLSNSRVSIGGDNKLSQTLVQSLPAGQYVFSFQSYKATSFSIGTGGGAVLAPNCLLYVGDTLAAALSSNTTRYLLDVPEGASVSVKLGSPFVGGTVPDGSATITRAMFQRGNKPTAYQRAMQYLTEAIQNGSTDIIGGLVLSNIIGVKNQSGSVTGGMSGLDDGLAFWTGAGLTNRDTAPYRVYQSGKVIMQDAEVKGKVEATSGEVGGFEIASGRIGVADNDTVYGMSMYDDFIKFSKSNSWAGIGTNVMPSPLKGLCRLECKDGAYDDTTGLHIDVRKDDPVNNYLYVSRAIDSYGIVRMRGSTCLYDDTYIGAANSYIMGRLIGITHTFVFTTAPNAITIIYLPKPEDLTRAYGSGSYTFLLHIQVGWLADIGQAGNKLRISGVDGAHIVHNSSRPNTNINTNGCYDIGQGQGLTLRYLMGDYYIQSIL